MALDDERCCFCRREVLIREWAARRGWLEVECPVCGLYRAERQFWVAAHFKKATKPVLFRGLARWLAEHRDRAQPPEIPFEGWETRKETHMDALAQFKATQRQAWAHFTPFELTTCTTAPRLVAFAGVRAGQRVLDVGCGTGVVAITARRRGAQIVGLDLTPELLQRARENAAVADADVEWREGDAERLPFEDGVFDVVLSQFGHMFAPRPEVATGEMLRVLKPGGLIGFSTWPPELCIGRIFTLVGRYLPPPPAFVSPPPQWGDPAIVRDRLGAAVTDLVFDRAVMLVPTLSPAHYRLFFESNAGPVLRLVQTLQDEPARLAEFRREFEAITTQYFHDNVVRQDYLLTRATKV